MLKKIGLSLIAVAIIYVGIGDYLLYIEKIQRLYIFPGWSIKHGATDEDESTVSSDGPIIIYENDRIFKYQVDSNKNKLEISHLEIKKQDNLYCFVDETKDKFSFQLKDSLSVEPDEYKLPRKMLILSDIEGNFNGFKSILLGNKIIDDQFNWTFGDNHLVLVGDFFDRGLNVKECLGLIYKLEKEAEKQGGKVHFLLGNHEMMNLKENYKYVRDKYHENADTLGLEYEKWYSANTELGRWLRTKNGVEKIGDYLFVHAGIRKDFPKNYSLNSINENIRKAIDQNFSTKEDQRDNIFIGNESPIWYRVIGKEKEAQSDVEKTLQFYNFKKMIIGHTIMDEINYLYDGKIIAIDLEHKENSDKGKMFALWFENNEFKITDHNGKKRELN